MGENIETIFDLVDVDDDFETVTDLEKFKAFFDEMNIKYIKRENNGGNHCISIHYSHIYQSYGNAIDLIFDKDDNFIEFEAWGE